jgi:hypothetical protein
MSMTISMMLLGLGRRRRRVAIASISNSVWRGGCKRGALNYEGEGERERAIDKGSSKRNAKTNAERSNDQLTVHDARDNQWSARSLLIFFFELDELHAT